VHTVLVLQDLGRLDALPGGRQLDQNSLLVDAQGFVQGDQLQGLLHALLGVEGQAGIDLGGNATGHNLQDFRSEQHAQVVHGLGHLLTHGAANDGILCSFVWQTPK